MHPSSSSSQQYSRTSNRTSDSPREAKLQSEEDRYILSIITRLLRLNAVASEAQTLALKRCQEAPSPYKACIQLCTAPSPSSVGLTDLILCTMQEFHDDAIQRQNVYGESFSRRMLMKVSQKTSAVPSILFVQGVSCVKFNSPVGMGSFADVFLGSLGGRNVALKRLRTAAYEDAAENWKRPFFREALLWHQLQHKNILEFIGLDERTFDGCICMVSPWMSNENLAKYIAKNSSTISSIQKLRWIIDIMSGLTYLHAQDVIHGDLRGANILLDDNLQAHISDFGLSMFVGAGLSTMGMSAYHEGAVRWMAPEVIKSGICTTQGDVYSFGCVCLEIFSESYPYSDVKNDRQLMLDIYAGRQLRWPSQSRSASADEVTIRELAQRCWIADSASRPSMESLPDLGDLAPAIKQNFATECSSPTATIRSLTETPNNAEDPSRDHKNGDSVAVLNAIPWHRVEYIPVRPITLPVAPTELDNLIKQEGSNAVDVIGGDPGPLNALGSYRGTESNIQAREGSKFEHDHRIQNQTGCNVQAVLRRIVPDELSNTKIGVSVRPAMERKDGDQSWEPRDNAACNAPHRAFDSNVLLAWRIKSVLKRLYVTIEDDATILFHISPALALNFRFLCQYSIPELPSGRCVFFWTFLALHALWIGPMEFLLVALGWCFSAHEGEEQVLINLKARCNVKVIRYGKEMVIDVHQAVLGDTAFFRHDDIIPYHGISFAGGNVKRSEMDVTNASDVMWLVLDPPYNTISISIMLQFARLTKLLIKLSYIVIPIVYIPVIIQTFQHDHPSVPLGHKIMAFVEVQISSLASTHFLVGSDLLPERHLQVMLVALALLVTIIDLSVTGTISIISFPLPDAWY